jgi:salicylate hydroxylase
MGNENKHLHVAIVGGGIAGLALALGLNRANISYTLYEASPKFTTVGAGISLGPNALRAMDLLDPRLTEPYSQISSGHRVQGKEHVFFEFMLAEKGFGASRGFHGATVESEHFIKSTAHRHDLMRIMENLLPPDTLKLGKRAASVTQDDDGAKITFDDGEIAVADVVVGCDGGKGLTRKAVLGDKFPDEVEVAYANRYVYRTVIPSGKAQEILGEYAGSGRIFMGPGHYVMFYELSDGQYNLVAGVQDEQPWTQPKWTYEVSKEEMYEDFKGCDPRLDKLLDVSSPWIDEVL